MPRNRRLTSSTAKSSSPDYWLGVCRGQEAVDTLARVITDQEAARTILWTSFGPNWGSKYLDILGDGEKAIIQAAIKQLLITYPILYLPELPLALKNLAHIQQDRRLSQVYTDSARILDKYQLEAEEKRAYAMLIY